MAVFGAAAAYSQITLNPVPERAVGTPALAVTNSNPNLVEGREFFSPQAVVVDTSVSPAILYVSDYNNNRVLGWRNAAGFTTGQKADLVIGQPDFVTTFPEGTRAFAAGTSTYTTGLNRPSGLAVDKNGNLYVADAGDNRVLRYPTPFAQTSQIILPDLALGQATYTSGYNPNYPGNSSLPTPLGLFLSDGSHFLVSNLAFDSSGNLWVVDTGNARVVRFNASVLAGTGGGVSADLELGQVDLNSSQTPLSSTNINSYYKLNQFISPTALGFDANGDLFVGDYDRALVFTPPFSSGMSASAKQIGVYPQNYTAPSGTTVQQLADQTSVVGASAFFFLSGGAAGVGVVDAAQNRILIFDVFANWPTDGTPPVAKTILGQPNLCPTIYVSQTCKAPNNGNPQTSGLLFSAPAGVAYTGTHLYLADAGNNRVIDLPQLGAGFGSATRVLGQDYLYANSVNLIEGREFQFTGRLGNNSFADAGMVIDSSTGTPHLYVSDSYNNRVLGFYDLRTFCFLPSAACANGGKNKADIVIGQADFTTALVNYPTGDPNQPSKSNLDRPIGLAVDAQGNLYVADSLNERVLRFPAPFAYAGMETRAGVSKGAAPEPADLVLGQQNFTSKIPDPTSASMATPYGLAFTPSCSSLTAPCPAPNGLVVSDESDNRVLYFPATNGAFAAGSDNGKAATVVFGQTGFTAVGVGSGSSTAGLNGPHHISCDTDGNVYVADTGNNRVLVFPDPHGNGTAPTGQAATASVGGLSAPEGVFVSPITGEIWVTNTAANPPTSLRFANYTSVVLALGSINGIVDVSGSFGYHPLAITEDQYGDLFVADDSHRVALYFPGINVYNGASFASIANRPLAPGAVATIFPCASCAPDQFGDQTNKFLGPYPVPTSMSNVQVLVDGVLAPLYYVGAPAPPAHPTGQINFIIPNSARQSGYADLQVVQASTGQILGATQVPMYSVAPGAFEETLTGAKVYAAAINQDGTINGPNNPAVHGQVISLYLTGQGAIPNGPPDGVPATTPIWAQWPVTVLLNGTDVNSPVYQESSVQHILYSGINGLPGVWQINVQIPATVSTTSGVWFAVISNSLPNWDAGSGYQTFIYVK
jgi:uncharacterized protein (TIGR03437 family)